MLVLITGVAGFIGSHLAEACLDRGDEVVGIDNLLTGRRENVPDDVHFIEGDIADPEVYGPEWDWDLIYHCAASYKDRDYADRDARTNVLGTINVIDEARSTGARLVYFQTSLCYGPAPLSPVYIDAPLDPHGSYAVSKTAGEAYIRDSGVSYVSLRLANMYGPRNLSGPVPTFYKRLSEGKPCTVVDSRRDFVFIDDLVEVAMAAATRGSGVYHVASGHDTSIQQLFDTVATAMGVLGDREVVPRGPDDVATILLDPSHTEQDYHWRVQTPLDVGVAAAVDWYRAHGVTETYTHLQMKG